MSRLILFNKPYGVLSQFTDQSGRPTLSDYLPIKKIYPAGRLDYDSEGLLLLTDDGILQQQLSHPRYQQEKTYWAQVEGVPSEKQLVQLRRGLLLNDGLTKPASAIVIAEPEVWPRNPPIRVRAHIPTCWLEIKLQEGRNRQVRRMTAAIGHPTLRLIRYACASWTLGSLLPGEWKEQTLQN